jgi:hypothetical protein
MRRWWASGSNTEQQLSVSERQYPRLRSPMVTARNHQATDLDGRLQQFFACLTGERTGRIWAIPQ